MQIGSTLQYVNDWQKLLSMLVTSYKPAYFVFCDLLAGDIPTFVSHPIFCDKKIPHRFFNWNIFKQYMEDNCGFKVIFESKFIHKILVQEEVFPNFVLPELNQIVCALNAVFYIK